jgi:hypothetical protein
MKVSLDKLAVVTTLNLEEIKLLKSRFVNRHNCYFHFAFYKRRPQSFVLCIHPINTYVLRYYNTLLIFNPSDPAEEALEILNMISLDRWSIKRLDIAFDFYTKLEDTFFLPPAGNIRKKRVDTTYYFGTPNSRKRVCIYDKSKELRDVHNIYSLRPITRVEIRLGLKLKPITDYSHRDFAFMEKFYFVPDTKEFRGFRCLLKAITQGRKKWADLKRTEKQEIKKRITEHVSDMYTLFLEYVEGDVQTFLTSSLISSSLNSISA